jgi:hypothetical protein
VSIHLNQVTKKLRAVGVIREDQSPRAAIMTIVQGTAKRYFDATSGLSILGVIALGLIGLATLNSNVTISRTVWVLGLILAVLAPPVMILRLHRRARAASTIQESRSGSDPAATRGYALAIVGADLISLPVDLMSRPCGPADTVSLTSIQSVEVADSKTFLGFRAARTLTVRYKDGPPTLFVEYMGPWDALDSFARLLGSETPPPDPP